MVQDRKDRLDVTIMKNYSLQQALQKLAPILERLSCGEQAQLLGLVQDYGYQGAMTYLDPTKKYLPPTERDQRMVESHFNILKNL